MEKKKLSTQDILARARQQAGSAAGGSPAESAAPKSEPAPEASAPEPAQTGDAPEAPAPKAAPKPAPGGGPKSTKDILAAARAQAAGGKPAAAPAGGAPKSTAEKLAAARAQAAGGAKPAAAAAEGAPAAAKAALPAKPAGDRPSVEEMLRAVREGKTGELVKKAGPAEVVIPPKPVKPVPVAKGKPTESRRNALVALLVSPFAMAWAFLTLSSTIGGLAVARFMMPNVLVEPPSKFKVGPLSDYPPGVVSTKWTSQFGVWIVHNVYKGKDLVYALSTVCTHLGCTPNWLEGEQKFKCPCHGSGFYITGINFEGPAPRPLERHGIRIAEDGMLEVDKSVKFQEEMGQWEDPACFVPVA
ncbi:MAG: ubiquinol-cytochrome c reductase iron-sulfur subunit [Planctomycetaceae bacterium]